MTIFLGLDPSHLDEKKITPHHLLCLFCGAGNQIPPKKSVKKKHKVHSHTHNSLFVTVSAVKETPPEMSSL